MQMWQGVSQVLMCRCGRGGSGPGADAVGGEPGLVRLVGPQEEGSNALIPSAAGLALPGDLLRTPRVPLSMRPLSVMATTPAVPSNGNQLGTPYLAPLLRQARRHRRLAGPAYLLGHTTGPVPLLAAAAAGLQYGAGRRRHRGGRLARVPRLCTAVCSSQLCACNACVRGSERSLLLT